MQALLRGALQPKAWSRSILVACPRRYTTLTGDDAASEPKSSEPKPSEPTPSEPTTPKPSIEKPTAAEPKPNELSVLLPLLPPFTTAQHCEAIVDGIGIAPEKLLGIRILTTPTRVKNASAMLHFSDTKTAKKCAGELNRRGLTIVPRPSTGRGALVLGNRNGGPAPSKAWGRQVLARVNAARYNKTPEDAEPAEDSDALDIAASARVIPAASNHATKVREYMKLGASRTVHLRVPDTLLAAATARADGKVQAEILRLRLRLYEHFGSFGAIQEVHVARDTQVAEDAWLARVTFLEVESAVRAVQLLPARKAAYGRKDVGLGYKPAEPVREKGKKKVEGKAEDKSAEDKSAAEDAWLRRQARKAKKAEGKKAQETVLEGTAVEEEPVEEKTADSRGKADGGKDDGGRSARGQAARELELPTQTDIRRRLVYDP
ncbi:hypothetical protein MKEN_01456500 [Mycena kentingensis (nom. inval.)]|nr:hypothetical protein MKEN_01456500 [Mycena kentingensis (nom. inval.)]